MGDCLAVACGIVAVSCIPLVWRSELELQGELHLGEYVCKSSAWRWYWTRGRRQTEGYLSWYMSRTRGRGVHRYEMVSRLSKQLGLIRLRHASVLSINDPSCPQVPRPSEHISAILPRAATSSLSLRGPMALCKSALKLYIYGEGLIEFTTAVKRE
jgi:hypothetical protein